MEKRFIPVYFIFIVVTLLMMISVYNIVITDEYLEVIEKQGSYTLTVAATRGKIYDCNLKPLAGGGTEYRAAIAPSSIDIEEFKSQISAEKFSLINENLKSNYPFAVTVDNKNLKGSGIQLFEVASRYSEKINAVHTVGYLDGSGKNGLTGIEKAYNDFLNESSGTVKITYQVDARGGVLAGYQPEIKDDVERSNQGVVLTLDSEIQEIVQSACDEMELGAAVVMEVPSGDIKAIVSKPDFSPLDIELVLDDEDAPLLNRAMNAYDVGSVFKLVTSAAALECGILGSRSYTCDGCYTIGVNTFKCNDGYAHGEMDMEMAISSSCNLYFIQLAQDIGADRLLKTAKILGFGKSITLAPGYSTSEGRLPSETLLEQPAALANFSFGQGELLATPMHALSLVGTIASKGMYITPRLVDRTIDKDGNSIEVMRSSSPHMAINESTARELSNFMHTAVLSGTARYGNPDNVTAAAKTGTAQTGMKRNGENVLQAWYAGFFPYENPRYVCIVLVENGTSGGKSAGPIFKEIAENVTSLK